MLHPAVLEWILKTTLLPFGITLSLALAIVLLLGREAGNERLRVFLGSLAVLAGGIGAFVALTGWPEFPPAQSWQWIAYISVFAGGIAAAEAFLPTDRPPGQHMKYVWRPAFALVAVGAVFWALWQNNRLGPTYQFVPLAAFALATLGCNPWDRAASRGLRGFFLAGALSAWVGAGALLILLTENARLCQICGAMACAIAGLLIPAALAGGKRLPLALIGWVPAWLAAICAIAYFLDATGTPNPTAFIVLGLAPFALMLWPSEAEAAAKRKLTLQVAALSLFGLMLIGALGFAYADSVKKAPASSSDDASSDYGY